MGARPGDLSIDQCFASHETTRAPGHSHRVNKVYSPDHIVAKVSLSDGGDWTPGRQLPPLW
ncbi:hypothetical protein GQ53DRAFT_754194 [Thozetella sp. PMI_491]|nr:hypothetical protein GQ53DRAFT_754194 [Thozetella sp. PMI_491]